MKHIIPKIGIGITVIFIIIIITQKDRLLRYASNPERNNNTAIVDSLLIFTNDETYKGSFLEFGAANCIQCKRMTRVVAETEKKYSDKIFVKNYNITESEGLYWSKKFGVVTIPLQILLNKKGKIVFKHFGYISTEELSKKIDNKILLIP